MRPGADGARAVTRCRVCGGSDWQEVVSFGDLPLANGYLDPADGYDGEPRYPLGVRSCRSCRLMSLTHVVDPEVLYRDYSYVVSDSELITGHMRYVATVCRERFGLPASGLVVEMGSNTGEQLQPFRQAGMRVLGVDPASNLAEVARERGVDTLAEFFTAATARRIVAEYGRAALLLGRHVFAHIDDLADVLAGARELLGPGGVFAIEVPYALDMLRHVEWDTVYHEHLSYFTVGSLRTLFARHGLRLVDVERVAVHGGSILVFAVPREADRPPSAAVGRLLSLEEESGIHLDRTYEVFAERVRHGRAELTALLRRLRDEGRRVAGYGAPAKGNTLLTVCGLGAGDLAFCRDTTKLKQGKVLPGSHIAVLSAEQAAQRPPDYYLLLAWNYAEEILRKERGFVEAGGRFILPIPEPRLFPAY